MCEICQNNVSRTYAHSMTREHKKRLLVRMRKKKEIAIKKYGWFKY